MSEAPLKATLKSGSSYDSPWLTVDADNPNDLEQKLRGIIDSKVLETVAEAASLFQATTNVAPLTQPQAPALAQGSSFGGGDRGLNPPQQQASNGWGAAQQQSAPPAQHQQQGGGRSQAAQQQQPQQQASNGWGAAQQQSAPPAQQAGAQAHPEGKQCSQCGAVLLYKVVNRRSDGKQFKFWACPNQKSRDDGHTTEFAN